MPALVRSLFNSGTHFQGQLLGRSYATSRNVADHSTASLATDRDRLARVLSLPVLNPKPTVPSMTSCDYPGCGHARAPRSLYCGPHSGRVYRYGSPDGRPIPRKWLYYWAVKARRVLEANADHSGLRMAVDELQRLMVRSRALVQAGDRSDPISRPMALLVDHGVTPIDLLAMVVAVALFERDQPRFLPNTEAYQLAVARAVCAYLPRRLNALNKTAARRLGSILTDKYSALTAGVLKAFENAEEASKRRDEAMAAPLTL